MKLGRIRKLSKTIPVLMMFKLKIKVMEFVIVGVILVTIIVFIRLIVKKVFH